MKTQSRNEMSRLQGYIGESAIDLCQRYEAGDFDLIHRHWLKYLPERGSLAIDVGAGSGRDAEALTRLGLRVGVHIMTAPRPCSH
ncbi:hypothetical protein HNQ77_000982 [Silvibacterium bohemicum]|uniref:Methyltransferase type 11 domain-containing protein n=1 Tax=Silvibacterium bohemicum TaxID=1577686 RepID=A0A841JX72_9BACT|nr:hypothetical protein [Silvibacterium bohemicum]